MRAEPANMSGLYPIIRRQRRPLMPVEVPAVPPKTEPVQSVVTTPPVEPAKTAPETPDSKNTSDDDTQN
jgi:hypothetical protein